MDRLKVMLVGVDFSPCAGAAVKQAVRIGALNRASVGAVHVVEVPVYAVPDGAFVPVEMPPVDLLLSSAREQWATWSARQEVGAGVDFEAVVGIPRLELLERVQRDSVDLLVVGARSDADGRRGVGPIAAACIQRAATRVLVVREGQSGAFRSIAVCIDFSETSRLALEQAIRMAALDGAPLHVVHVYGDPWRGIGPRDGVRVHMPDLAERYGRAVEKHLRTFCQPMAHEVAALKGKFHAVEFEGHGRGIVDFVMREHCDLVVLGTRARWNLRDAFWGSTAERVVREAPCSVLTVKPPGFEQM